MGTGSSRNQVTIETLLRPAPADDDSSDVVVTRKRHPPIRQPTTEKTLKEAGAEMGKLRQDLHDVTSIHNDDELEDIQDLEQTFDSLGIPSSSNFISDQVDLKIPDKPSHERDLSLLKTKWTDFEVGVPVLQNSPERDNCTENTATTFGWGSIRSSSGPQTRFDIPPSALLNNNNNNTKSAPMKFTWSPPEPMKSPDEWIYQKDALNEGKESSSSKTEDIVMLHPHSVPDYDLSEQQILDSIEKEFVS
ncbi:uncharacterized protein LOC110831383 isoform X2 [Zootermopsis nevadensis]|uniref:uncharacterized protein LOC110831383 isoform X2 n=1 Tax=Zootermopsis nevadensis TaxID=136037 RepID=UPI000B8E6A29|nr:uncharacterized protein LOC110831383 isoform X2 [Zootermopsis nevadensis]